MMILLLTLLYVKTLLCPLRRWFIFFLCGVSIFHNLVDKISILKVKWDIYHHFTPQSGFISFHHRAQGHMCVSGETLKSD